MLIRTSLCALLIATSATAQTAVSLDFGSQQVSASGAKVSVSDGFTLRQLGHWRDVEVGLTSDASAVTADNAAEATTTVAIAPSAAMPSNDNPCDYAQVPRFVPGLQDAVARRRLTWWRIVAATECRYGIPSGLLDALILQESRYHPTAVSPKGAIGLAQLMPATAGSLGVADPYDPSLNIDGGGRYLRNMLDRFNSITLGLAAYNAGPGAVRSARGIPQNGETPDYVRRVVDFWSGSGNEPLTGVRRMAQTLGFLGDKQ
jgi:soluble lytic murein transglycosylase-like protein